MNKINLSCWNVLQLKECIVGKPEYGANAPAVNFDPDLPRYIRITDITDRGTLRCDDVKSIRSQDAKKYILSKGDVLFARSGATVGKAYFHKEEGEMYAYAGYLIKFKLDQSIVSNQYFEQVTRSTYYERWVKSMLRAGAQPNINAKEYSSLEIPIPSLEEQGEIVHILSSWDRAIEKTENLISAKKKYFEWLRSYIIKVSERTTPMKFGDFLKESKIRDARNDPRKRLTVRLHLKGVAMREYRGTESEGATQYFTRKAGQLIYGKQNVFRGAIGIVPKSLDGYSSSQDIPAFDIADAVNADWLFWYLSRPSFYKRLERFSTGSGSNRLHPKELFKMSLQLPPFSEQKRIAHTLNAAQHEIVLLEELLNQYLTQKRGLMQKLLTGEWRISNGKVV